MSSKIGNTLGVAIGAAFIGSLSLSQLAAASPAFQASDLAAGYMLAAAEGKCGEGKCGVAKMDKDGDGKVSMAEATAGGFSESQFKAWDKNGDGMLDATELGTMHAAMDKGHMMNKDHKKGAEGSCGGDKKEKGAEGSCGGIRG
ncbi:MAG: hypothetical protein ACHP7D_01250 [Lysobacterales bacterium]